MPDLARLTASEAIALLASGALTAEELTRACIARIGERDDDVRGPHLVLRVRAVVEVEVLVDLLLDRLHQALHRGAQTRPERPPVLLHRTLR